MNDVIIDIETYGIKPGSVILVVAGIKFQRTGDMEKPVSSMNTFYRKINIDSCLEKGMKIDPETKKWWSEQDNSIKNEAFGGSRYSLYQVLTEFVKWFGSSRYIWSHGATFDIVMMEDALRRCNIPIPWKFWDCRDTRTLYDIAGVKNWDLPQQKKHNALWDCWREQVGIKMSYKKLFKK